MREPVGEAADLPAPLVRQVDADRAGEAVLGGELGGAVADEEQAGGVGHGHRCYAMTKLWRVELIASSAAGKAYIDERIDEGLGRLGC